MQLLRDGVHEAAFRMIQWPDEKPLYAFINGLAETSKELAMALEEIVNQRVAETAQAAFYAGFQAGRHPELLIFKESMNDE